MRGHPPCRFKLEQDHARPATCSVSRSCRSRHHAGTTSGATPKQAASLAIQASLSTFCPFSEFLVLSLGLTSRTCCSPPVRVPPNLQQTRTVLDPCRATVAFRREGSSNVLVAEAMPGHRSHQATGLLGARPLQWRRRLFTDAVSGPVLAACQLLTIPPHSTPRS
eukprot:272350-Chlamydomonas_euryale.AAC.3